MAIISKRMLLANTFGTLGYISCVLQWLFVVLLYLPLLLENDQFKSFLLPEKTEQVAPVATSAPSPILVGFALVFTVIMLIVTIVLIVRAPISIARTGKAATIKTAGTIIPLVIHHPLTPSKKRLLTGQLIKVIKLTFILFPFGLCIASILMTTALPSDVVVFASALLAIGSLVWFLAQYLAARLLRVKLDKLV